MKLSSNLFTQPRRSARLDKCLVDDVAHVTLKQPRESGEHVTRIQLALLAIMRNARFGTEAARAEYGPNTAAAVLAFKRERNILNTELRQTFPDNVVGKKTIAALDQEMLKKQLPPGRQPRVKMGVAPLRTLGFQSNDLLLPFLGLDLNDILSLVGGGAGVVLSPLDIFVLFDGGDPASEGQRRPGDEAAFVAKRSTPAYLLTHLPPKAIVFVGGRGAKNKAKDVANEVLQARAANKAGVTAIMGSSVGALPALACATELSGKITLDYVAINDGAFFAPNEVDFSPFKIKVPASPIKAARLDNFFQTFGHELLTHKQGAGGFMDGAEFHGPLDGFANVDVAANPNPVLKEKMDHATRVKNLLPEATPGRLKILKGHADVIHAKASLQGEAEIEKVLATLFKP